MDFVQPHLYPIVSVAWSASELGLLKLNFDGSCTQDLGLASYGGVIGIVLERF